MARQFTTKQDWALHELSGSRTPSVATDRRTLRSLERAGFVLRDGDAWGLTPRGEREAERATARLQRRTPCEARSNGSTIGHEVGVLPQGMTFDAAELAEAYTTGAQSARTHHPASDHLIARACDAYVKLAHVRRIAP